MTIGFPISHKENEYRRTILPEEIRQLSDPDRVYIEKGYGNVLGIPDAEYLDAGCHVCCREEVLAQKILCDPKIGDAEYLDELKEETVLFGWMHATQNPELVDQLIQRRLSAFAWEKMHEGNRHVFWKNNELAGEAAVLHAFQCFGMLPMGVDVAVLGNGNTAKGAVKALSQLEANTVQYNRRQEALFRRELNQYDVIVNCVLWDVMRKDHIIEQSDLSRMKKNALIIDVSCDKCGAVETSVPTTIDKPIYYVDGVCHYVVDHTPSLYYRTFSFNNSRVVFPYVRQLLDGAYSDTLQEALIIQDGRIMDPEITIFQGRE